MLKEKKNHSTVSTVNTHISLTLSKLQRNKTKRLVNKTASTGRTKHRVCRKCTSPGAPQQLRGLGSSTRGASGDRSCGNTNLHYRGEEQQERGELGELGYFSLAGEV